MDAYELSEAAQVALEGIVEYSLGNFGRERAERAAQRVFEAAEGLAERPRKGHRRDDLTGEAVLFWTIPRLGITLVYDPETRPLVILHIVGPGQDVTELLG